MTRGRIPTQKLTVLLLKKSVESPLHAVRKPQSLVRVPLRNDAPYEGELWYSRPRTRTPQWKHFVEPVLELPLGELTTSSVSAVLFVKAKRRFFAFTFGYGRNILKPNCYERAFGLRVALNRIHHERLRSMDLRTYEDIMVTTRKQTSRSAELAAFGLDISRDLLRAVTGEPDDHAFAKRLTGADALTFTAQITAKNLGEKCVEILHAFRDNRYKQHFEWVDHLSEVKDPHIVNMLNKALVETLKKRDTEKLHLAPPEVIDWQSVEKFRIGGTRREQYDDLDIDEYMQALGSKIDEMTIEKLKSYQVSVRWTGSQDFQNKWSFFSCIVWETNFNGRLYALVEGRWFEIERNFANRVNSFIASLPAPDRPLPPARKNEREKEYNRRVSADSSTYVCLDNVLVRGEDMSTSIEFCDLLSDQNELVYVKRKTRSATLSHLFAQGTVAARLFLQDANVREQLHTKLAGMRVNKKFRDLIPDRSTRPNPSDFKIVYAIIAKLTRNWPLSLPFFSQLNLMQNAKLLQGLGYDVRLQCVDLLSESNG